MLRDAVETFWWSLEDLKTLVTGCSCDVRNDAPVAAVDICVPGTGTDGINTVNSGNGNCATFQVSAPLTGIGPGTALFT